jgi:hypothetical protein
MAGPWGCCWQVRQWPPPKMKTSTGGPLGGAVGRSGSAHHRSWRRQWWAPWGVLSPGLAAATTEVKDINGGPHGGCCQQVWQRPALELETSMAVPLGGAVSRSGSGHHRS